jgi:predicted nucleic acid-binding protein
VEVRSSIARLFRQGLIDAQEKSGAISRLDLLSRGARQILPDNSVRSLAMDILDTYALRAGDSMQLVAALAWCNSRPSRRVFICADRRLSEAAQAAGFTSIEA